jgi:hypothetical protein
MPRAANQTGRRRFLGGLVTAALVLLGAPAAAVDLSDPPATTGPILADSAVPTPTGQLVVQPYLTLGVVRGSFTPGWGGRSAQGNFASLESPFKITYGLPRNSEVFVQASFIQNWAGGVTDATLPGRRAASYCGAGDTLLVLKHQLLAETAQAPTVTAYFGVNLPTGHHFYLNPARLGMDSLGTGTLAFTPGVNLSKWLGPVYLYANLWYSFTSRNPGVAPHQLAGPLLLPVHGRDLVTWNLAAEWPLAGGWVALLEFYSTWDVGPLFRTSSEPRSALLGLSPGLEYVFSPGWGCALGVAVDLAGRNSFYAITPIATVEAQF